MPPMPMTYREIADDMQARIKAGEYPADKPLPSHAKLAEQYDVSVSNAYRVYTLLVDRGIVFGRAGRGMFIVSAPGT